MKAYDLAPEHEFVEELTTLYRLTGDLHEAESSRAAVLRSYEEHEAQGWNVDLEYARFCAAQDTDLSQALQRVESEFRRRPGNVEVLDTDAWLLYKNDRPAAAS